MPTQQKTKTRRSKIQSPSASYLGVTMAIVGNEFFLYVANFAQNRIEVYDKNWV